MWKIISRICRLAFIFASIFAMIYFASAIISIFEIIFIEKIRTGKELEEIIKIERRKLNIPANVKIVTALHKSETHGCADCVLWTPGDDRNFEMYIETKLYSSVRHEMYHIKRLVSQKAPHTSLIRYFLLEEPLALIYEHTGIDLDRSKK